MASTLEPMHSEYGRRAHAAANASGADYKAMMHALRVSGEAIELMQTGNITFPRQEAPHLLRARKGEIPFEELSEEIDERLVRLNDAVEKSSLPDSADRELADSFVLKTYRAHLEEIIGR